VDALLPAKKKNAENNTAMGAEAQRCASAEKNRKKRKKYSNGSGSACYSCQA
jgi:hypothetical protein